MVDGQYHAWQICFSPATLAASIEYIWHMEGLWKTALNARLQVGIPKKGNGAPVKGLGADVRQV